jgi:trk system potassium uptake protein
MFLRRGCKQASVAAPRKSSTNGRNVPDLFLGGGRNVRIIIIGAGDVGLFIAQTLSREHHDVTVIEVREEIARRVSQSLDIRVITGSGTNPEVLDQAGIAQTDMLIAVTDRDEVNIIACIIASSRARIPMKVARVRDEIYARVLEQLHVEPFRIDLCIRPEQEAASAALKLMEIPGVREVAEFADGKVLLVGTTVDEGSPFLNRPLQEIQADGAPGDKILIVALRRGAQLIIPHGRDVIYPDDEIFLIAERERVLSVLRSLGKMVSPPERIIVYGASKVALYLASQLEESAFSSKLICSDEALCNRLLMRHNRVAILCGEGTDQDLLLEFNVQDADYFVSASDDEEENILVSLLAKRLGARRSMALVSRLSYISLVSSIGVDVVLNPQMAAVNRILRHIRKGEVLSVATLGTERAEAIEAVATDASELVNRPLKEIRFPQDAIIGAVVRDTRIIIPHGETVIQPGDRVVIFAKRRAIPEVERALMVQVELP